MTGTADLGAHAVLGVSLLVIVAYGALYWSTFGGRHLWISSQPRDQGTKWQGYQRAVLYWGSPILVMAVWGIVTARGDVLGGLLPAPDAVLSAGWSLLVSGTLLDEARISLQRVFVGFVAASAVGVSLGLLAGTFMLARHLVVPTNSFLRYIPPTAFVALLIVYFGVGEVYKYAVVFFGVIFFITQMVVDVVDDVDVRHVELAQTSGYGTRDVFLRVIVPLSAPRIVDVLRINLGAAWTFLVAAELIGAERGLGHFVAVSQRFLRLPDLYVGILTFGVIGLVSDRAVDLLARRCFRWRYVQLHREKR